ncbi:MAG: LysM peptidoglycan-binding domain-containing protein [Thermodesulfobacteriota bacterium]
MQTPNRFRHRHSPRRYAAIAAVMLLSALTACAPMEGGGDGLAPPPAARPHVPPPVMTFTQAAPHLTLKTPAIPLEDDAPATAAPVAAVEAGRKTLHPEEQPLWEEGPSATAAAPEIAFDFPMVMNPQVEHYLNYFQNNLRRRFSDWLGRASRYLPMIQEKLRSAGLPEDLAYLPLIESGFNLHAYSPASAVGPWQFMRGTARQYGLTVNEYVDERRDPVKSTQAAVEYLRDLYEEFGSWHLAVAAYNAGGGRIRRATQKYETDDFWEIAATSHLSTETQQYVPKLIAAIMIAKEPGKYGFSDINCDDTFCYETVYVPRRTALAAVALASSINLDVLEDLNSELRRGMTPPEPAVYALKVPPGSKEAVLRNLSRVRAVTETRFKEHVVKKGDTIPRLSKKYGVKKSALLKANKLRKEKIKVGQRLRIPYTTTAYTMVAQAEPRKAKSQKEARTPLPKKDHRIVHRIRAGETLSSLARRYRVSVEQIIAWNRLKNPKQLQIGQKVILYPATAATSSHAPGIPAAPRHG